MIGRMSKIRVAVFAATETSHFTGVLAIARELVDIGAMVRLWTDNRFRGQIMAAGIEFGDLFEHGTIDEADPSSFPRVARIVTFSVQNCEAIARTVADWRSDVIFVEGHTLIGQLIAQRLSRPWVLINAGHLPNGPALRKLLLKEFPTVTSERCMKAVQRLKTEFGHEDASPTSYISLPSPWMNIHLEPPQWLISGFDDQPRQVECFGSHLPILQMPAKTDSANRSDFRIYAAFGTIVWRYWTNEALSFLEPLADAVERLSYSLTIGLGGAVLSDDDMKRTQPRLRDGVALCRPDKRASLARPVLYAQWNEFHA